MLYSLCRLFAAFCTPLQLRRYPQLPRDAAGLSALCAAPSRAQDVTGDGKFQWRGDTPILAFGKHAGERETLGSSPSARWFVNGAAQERRIMAVQLWALVNQT